MNKFLNKSSEKGSTAGIAIAVIIIVVILLATGRSMYKNNQAENASTDGTNGGKDSNMTTAQEIADRMKAGNDEIKEAFGSFKAYAESDIDNNSVNGKQLPRFTTLCSAGFISEAIPDLKSAAEKIFTNRILNVDPLQYAINQDEAGISCLSSNSKWVLFTALNAHSENSGKDYYCLDSSGKSGNIGLDRTGIACMPAPVSKRPADSTDTFSLFRCEGDKTFKVDFIGPEPDMNDVAGAPAKAKISIGNDPTILTLEQSKNDPHLYSSNGSEFYVEGDEASLTTKDGKFEKCEAAKI